MQVIVEAYYNFLGHKTKFTNKMIDELVNKAVELKCPQAIHDVN